MLQTLLLVQMLLTGAGDSSPLPRDYDARLEIYKSQRAVLFEERSARARRYRRGRLRRLNSHMVWVEIQNYQFSHYEFAVRYAELFDEPIDPVLKKMFDPPLPRKYGLMGLGYGVGVVGLGVAAYILQASAMDRLECDSTGLDCRNARRLQDISLKTAAGAGGVILLTTVYTIASSHVSKRKTVYYRRHELQAMVERYNSALRQRYGIKEADEQRLRAQENEEEFFDDTPYDNTAEGAPTTPAYDFALMPGAVMFRLRF